MWKKLERPSFRWKLGAHSFVKIYGMDCSVLGVGDCNRERHARLHTGDRIEYERKKIAKINPHGGERSLT